MIKVACFGLGKLSGFIDKFYQTVWTVIRKLNLQPMFTVAVVWLAVVAFSKVTVTVFTVFAVLVGLSLIYAVAATVYGIVKFLKEAPKKKQGRARQRVNDIPDSGITDGGPVYYRVMQNPRYVMAEYPDRYELYFDNNGDLELVKVNLRNNGEVPDDGNLQ